MKTAELKRSVALCDPSVWRADSVEMLWLARSGLWLKIPELERIVRRSRVGMTLGDVIRILMAQHGGDYVEPKHRRRKNASARRVA